MKKKWVWILGSSAVVIAVIIVAGRSNFEHAYFPGKDAVINTKHHDGTGVDINNRTASNMRAVTDENKKDAVKVDDDFLKLGRHAFFQETFGNEIFLTDVLGILNGPLTFTNIMKSIVALHGKGTSNLRVPIAADVTLGTKTFHKGEKIDTGIDVAKGAYTPLGLPVHYDSGKIRIGVSCAACHATVDRRTRNVVVGAPNNDFNLGTLIALGTNSTTYFTHTQIVSLKNYVDSKSGEVTTSKGTRQKLPDPKKLEAAVDSILIQWPRGNFDSTIDMKANPSQIPDSFTKGDFPYSWSGFAQAGHFHGLSVFTNNVHAQNTDPLSQAPISQAMFGIDKEVYIGTILQNAANPAFRYDPAKENEKPSAFFAKVDPTPGVPGMNQLIRNPIFPKVSAVAPDGLIASSPGHKVNEENNAMAAWQNTIIPPKPRKKSSEKSIKLGRAVFNKAGCLSCHAGSYLTNNRITPAKVVGTDPSRAMGMKKIGKVLGPSLMYAPNTPVPLPMHPKVLKVQEAPLGRDQMILGYALGNSKGGYKVPSLNGLFWTAPYLHDGGVAVGKDANKQLGLPGTVDQEIPVDPMNSLRALIDRDLRAKVVRANRKAGLAKVHVKGSGHNFWVDKKSGFTKAQQDALIDYLISVTK